MEWTTKMEGGGTLYLRDDGHYMYLEANRPGDHSGLYKVILQGMQGGQVLGTMEPHENGLRLSRMVTRGTMGQWGCLPLTKVICQVSYPFPPMEESPLTKEDVFSPDFSVEMDVISPEEEKKEEVSFLPAEVDQEEIGQGKTLASHPLSQWEEVEVRAAAEPISEQKEEILWTEVATGGKEGFFPCSGGQGVADRLLEEGISAYVGVLRKEEKGGFSLAIPFSLDKEFPLTPLFCLAVRKEVEGKDYLLFSFGSQGRPCPHF